MNPRRALIALAVGLVAAAAGTPAGAQEPAELQLEAVDARQFPVVSVLVTPPPGLYGVSPDTVELRENGILRPATTQLLAQDPLHVLLIVDTSGSMAGAPLAAAKQAAADFIAALPETTRTAVMGFAATPSPVTGFSADPAQALAALAALPAGGETALYDAVVAATEAFAAESGGRRFIVLLSDGGDTVSAASVTEATARLEEAGIGFYAVELETAESDYATLVALAGVSAGRVVPAQDPAALGAVYDTIASELRNQLLITYTTLTGGPTQLVITITHAGVSATGEGSFVLPETGVTTTATTTTVPPTTTAPAETSTTAASLTPYISPGPGPLGASWVRWTGLAAFFVAAFIVFGLALLPGRRARHGLAPAARERFASAGGLLTRVTDRAKGLAEAGLRRVGRQPSVDRALDSAGVRLTAGEFVVLTVCVGLVGTAVGGLLLSLPGALLFGTLGLVAPRLWVLNRQINRRTAFADQLDGTLQLLAGSLRAGYGLLQSINTAAAEAPLPTSQELGRVTLEHRLGRDLSESLSALADRMDSQDFRWVAQAIEIQRAVGGDLAQVLDTVAQTIRERNQIRRQIRALSAEGRMSAVVLIVLPMVVAGILWLTAPDFLTPLWQTSAGRIAVAIGVALWVVGILWIRRLIRLRF